MLIPLLHPLHLLRQGVAHPRPIKVVSQVYWELFKDMERIKGNVRLRMGREDFILVGVMRGLRGLMLGIRLVDDEKREEGRREDGEDITIPTVLEPKVLFVLKSLKWTSMLINFWQFKEDELLGI